ncbi:hypothetical protein [Arenibaculum pallidiluteum]|uniref:hypothetical protein n=1 Tax=Arenibaculum pallidiluteum TaxID=2812559 RepID=UPI001A95E0E0|nr:hypothetical protein [Arenibaculum pallidiluteum]
MSVLWFAVSLYLVFAAVAVYEAEVDPMPGAGVAEICLAALLFALAEPLRSLLRRVRTII